MRGQMDTAVSVAAEKSLTAEANIHLGIEQKQVFVDGLIALMIGRYMDWREERQDERRRIAEKIKMYKN